MSCEDLPCNAFVELATEYLEGALPAEQRLIVELHLAFCSPCADYHEQMRAVVATAGTLHEEEVPGSVMDSLVRAFKTSSGDEPS